MTTTAGRFVWYELVTNDPKPAEIFYKKVFGWDFEDFGNAQMPYTLVRAGDRRIAGIMPMPPDMRLGGCRSNWLGYVAVGDVDAMAEALMRAGGTIHKPPADIPTVGRFAVVSDPQGARFILFRGDGTPPPASAPGQPGHFGWHELYAHDWGQVFGFYETLFGWRKGEAIDLGAMGTYQLFHAKDAPMDGMATGGMMSLPGPPAPSWLYYVNVEEIDAATERLRQAGGAIINGPMEVPGGMWVVQAADPQGANFAILGRRG